MNLIFLFLLSLLYKKIGDICMVCFQEVQQKAHVCQGKIEKSSSWIFFDICLFLLSHLLIFYYYYYYLVCSVICHENCTKNAKLYCKISYAENVSNN